MRLKTKILALALAASMTVPLAFTGCKGEDGETYTAVGENTGENGEASDEFGKSYLEKNTTDAVLKSVNLKDILGDDDVFAMLYNKSGTGLAAKVDLSFDSGPDINVAAYANGNPYQLRLDAVVEDLPGILRSKTVDASVYLDEEEISVASELFLDDLAVGFRFEDLGSIVDKFMDSDIAEFIGLNDEDDINDILKYVGDGVDAQYVENVINAAITFYNEAVKSDRNVKAANELLDYTDSLCGKIGEDTYYAGDTEYGTYVVEWSVDGDDIVGFTEKLSELFEKNTDAGKELISAIASCNEKVEEAIGRTGLSEAPEQFAKQLEKVFENVDFEGNLTVYLEKKTGKFLKAEFKMNVEDDELKVKACLVDDGIEFEYMVDSESYELSVDGSITRQSSDKEYSLVLKTETEDEAANYSVYETTEYGFVVDKENGTYELYRESTGEQSLEYSDGKFDANDYEGSLRFKGNIEYSDNTFGFTLENAYVDGEKRDIPFDIEVKLEDIDKVEKHSGVTSIFDITEKQITSVATNAMKIFR